MDCLDLKKISWGIKGDYFSNTKEYNNLKDNYDSNTSNSIDNKTNTSSTGINTPSSNFQSNKNSEKKQENEIEKNINKENFSNKKYSIDNNRKGSINPSNLDYLRRSRFNSRADELKNTLNNQDLMNELVANLGADMQFYQSFKLSDEEFQTIKEKTEIFIHEWNNNNPSFQLQEKEFSLMTDEIPCEKFISVGHMLEIMFSKNTKEANSILEILLFFFDKGIIDREDIKHG